jgi:outer membrane lipase/esterase
MSKVQRLALLAVLLCFTALSAAVASGFDQLVVFGDSTLDTGYFRYTTTGKKSADDGLAIAIQFGATGGWAGNGVMNTTILAGKFGLSAAPCDDGGSNYANGGATTMNNLGAAVPDNVDFVDQIKHYLSAVNGVANPDALYLVKIGDNDATYVTNQIAKDPTWLVNHPDYLDKVAAAMAAGVASLQKAGARTIVVRNSYDSALFAQYGGSINPINSAAYARSKALGTSEWSDLAARGVRFIPDDNDSLFSYIAHNPRLFGFNPWTVLATNAPFYTSPPSYTACMCILTPDQQRDFLFIDGIHLTTAGQTIEADYTYSLLAAPSEISMLAESVVQGGWARAATIQAQLDPCGQNRGPCGVNFWTAAGAASLEFRNAPGFANASGTPFGGTVGVDYRTPDGVVMGAAFTTGSQIAAFSTGGRFDEVDEAPSLYVGYVDGPLWGNAVLTFDAFQDSTTRLVPLGIFTDQDNGSTTGHSLALALRGGGNLPLERVTTGPVAGLVLQRVQVGGFTETGTSGVTALSFGDQTRDSCVSQLGWRACVDLGRFRPFAEADWNHELACRDRTITTSLTTVQAPSYTMAAVPAASDWCSSSLGAYYQLSPQVILRGAASAIINPQMVSCGGELGMNVCF